MNRLIIISILILSANRIFAEMGSMSRCLASFEFKDGQIIEAYFHTTSDAFYEKKFSDKYHFKNYVKDSIEFINEAFTELTRINCPKSNPEISYYSIYRSNFITLNFDSIIGVTFIDFVVIPWDSYVPIENDSLILELTKENCICINFDVDMEIQDKGGDSIESYYLFTTDKTVTYKQAEFEIREILRLYNSSIGKLPYPEKENEYYQYILDLKKTLKPKKYFLLVHY